MKKVNARFIKIVSLSLPAALFLLALGGCSLFGGGSPTAVMKAFIEAARKKDAAAMKTYLSDDSIRVVRSAAQSAGRSEDEMLTTFSDTIDATAEVANEKIEADGRSASVELKSKNRDPQTIWFVKEGSWKIATEKPKPASEAAKTTPTDSPATSGGSTPAETGPATLSASALIDEAKSGGSELDKKYGGRMLTVTGAELWEIQYSMLHIGAKYGSYSSGYIICEGSFSEYQPYASKISDLRKAGKSPGATVKGSFSRVTVDGGYTQVHLSPCVLADLEKP